MNDLWKLDCLSKFRRVVIKTPKKCAHVLDWQNDSYARVHGVKSVTIPIITELATPSIQIRICTIAFFFEKGALFRGKGGPPVLE